MNPSVSTGVCSSSPGSASSSTACSNSPSAENPSPSNFYPLSTAHYPLKKGAFRLPICSSSASGSQLLRIAPLKALLPVAHFPLPLFLELFHLLLQLGLHVLHRLLHLARHVRPLFGCRRYALRHFPGRAFHLGPHLFHVLAHLLGLLAHLFRLLLHLRSNRLRRSSRLPVHVVNLLLIELAQLGHLLRILLEFRPQLLHLRRKRLHVLFKPLPLGDVQLRGIRRNRHLQRLRPLVAHDRQRQLAALRLQRPLPILHVVDRLVVHPHDHVPRLHPAFAPGLPLSNEST